MVGARSRIARIARIGRDVRRARGHGRDKSLGRHRVQHVLLIRRVGRVRRIRDGGVPFRGDEDDVVVLQASVDLHLLVRNSPGGGDPVRPGQRCAARRERGDDGEDADVQHDHRHEELEHAEAALIARAQVHASAIGIPLKGLNPPADSPSEGRLWLHSPIQRSTRPGSS